MLENNNLNYLHKTVVTTGVQVGYIIHLVQGVPDKLCLITIYTPLPGPCGRLQEMCTADSILDGYFLMTNDSPLSGKGVGGGGLSSLKSHILT